MDGPDHLTSLKSYLLLFSIIFFLSPARLFFFSRYTFFSLSSNTSRSFPFSSSPQYLLPLLHGHIRQHLQPPPQHLHVASPSLCVTTSGHGSVTGHGRVASPSPSLASTMKHMVRSPKMVSSLTMVASLAMVASLVSITVACRISDHGLVFVLVCLPST